MVETQFAVLIGYGTREPLTFCYSLSRPSMDPPISLKANLAFLSIYIIEFFYEIKSFNKQKKIET